MDRLGDGNITIDGSSPTRPSLRVGVFCHSSEVSISSYFPTELTIRLNHSFGGIQLESSDFLPMASQVPATNISSTSSGSSMAQQITTDDAPAAGVSMVYRGLRHLEHHSAAIVGKRLSWRFSFFLLTRIRPKKSFYKAILTRKMALKLP